MHSARIYCGPDPALYDFSYKIFPKFIKPAEYDFSHKIAWSSISHIGFIRQIVQNHERMGQDSPHPESFVPPSVPPSVPPFVPSLVMSTLFYPHLYRSMPHLFHPASVLSGQSATASSNNTVPRGPYDRPLAASAWRAAHW